jgi:glycosyltransferase involved in cell wall biosynthesis
MKIAHIQPSGFNENLGYQENMLSKYHRKMGLDVVMVTSTNAMSSNGRYAEVAADVSYLKDGTKIIRLKFVNFLPKFLASRFRVLSGMLKVLKTEKPDIIFLHGPQAISNLVVIEYIKFLREIGGKEPLLYVDNHADLSNSATNKVSYFVHKTLWKYVAKSLEPYAKKFYGVLPARCTFLREMYGISEEKIEFLPMGADDEKIVLDPVKRTSVRMSIREKYGIDQDDFLILTGGKIDIPKRQTLLLMKAVKRIESQKVKLLVFGSVVEELRNEFMSLVDDRKIKYIGWVKSDKVYDLAVASDLAIFPGRHSVIWEQVVATGIPAVFKYWEGTTHVDLEGNCIFLYKDTENEIYETVMRILKDKILYEKMKSVALEKGPKTFLYSDIARRSIEMDKEWFQ